MLIDKNVRLIYENERGLSIPLSPIIGDLDSVYRLITADEQLQTQINSGREAGWHGENLQAFFMGTRDITLIGSIEWDVNNRDLIFGYKRTLEKTFNPTLKGKLTYKRQDKNKTYYLDGLIVEELPTFSVQEGSLKFMVSLRATDPFWRQTVTLEKLSFTQKNIFFPWSVRPKKYMGIVPKSNNTYFGLKRNNLNTAITNAGDVETGFKVVFIANGEVKNPSIVNLETGNQIRIVGNPGDYIMQKGDKVEVVSTPKVKNIIAGADGKGFKYLEEGSKFFLLPVGTTKIGFNADLNVSLLDVYLYYEPLLLGAENNA